jgi:hypothetical protein
LVVLISDELMKARARNDVAMVLVKAACKYARLVPAAAADWGRRERSERSRRLAPGRRKDGDDEWM